MLYRLLPCRRAGLPLDRYIDHLVNLILLFLLLYLTPISRFSTACDPPRDLVVVMSNLWRACSPGIMHNSLFVLLGRAVESRELVTHVVVLLG